MMESMSGMGGLPNGEEPGGIEFEKKKEDRTSKKADPGALTPAEGGDVRDPGDRTIPPELRELDTNVDVESDKRRGKEKKAG